MKNKQSSSSFNLPVLLSFNELAWIAIFGMALACVYAWRQVSVHEKKVGEQSIAIKGLENASTNFALISMLTNRIGELERENHQLVLILEDQRKETTRFSNLWERALATNAMLTMTIEKLTEDLKQSNPELVELRKQFVKLKEENFSLSNRLVAALSSLDTLAVELKKSQDEITQLKTRASEGKIRQELLSLKGGLTDRSVSNVVILLDYSGSMITWRDKTKDKDQRWRDATNVVNTWLSHLPIKNCALVLFNDQPKPFPRDGSWLRIDETNRSSLVAQLRGLKPEGATDTFKALRMAYSYPNVDTIILFTDGRPQLRESSDSKGQGGGSVDPESEAMMGEVLNLCTNRMPRIPVNTVGIGDYFNNDLGKFLRQLADHTGGTFIGR